MTSQFLIMKKIDFCVEISGILVQKHQRGEAFFSSLKKKRIAKDFQQNIFLRGISFINWTERIYKGFPL